MARAAEAAALRAPPAAALILLKAKEAERIGGGVMATKETRTRRQRIVEVLEDHLVIARSMAFYRNPDGLEKMADALEAILRDEGK